MSGKPALLATVLAATFGMASVPAGAVPYKTRAERNLLNNGVARSLLEIDASQLARERATLEQVRSMAVDTLEAHRRLNRELTRQAFRRGTRPPLELSRADRASLGILARKDGVALDQAYVNLVARLSERDLRTLERLRRTSSDAQLRRWSRAALPEVRQRLQRVKLLAASLSR